MPKKSPSPELQLSALGRERAELESAIEEMIAQMSEIPPEQRAGGEWAEHGEMTRQFLALSSRQGEVEKEIADISRNLLESAKSDRPH